MATTKTRRSEPEAGIATNVMLRPDQVEGLRELADSRERSKAYYIREAIDRLLRVELQR